MGWDDEPVGDDEALAVLQSDEKGQEAAALDEDVEAQPRWLSALMPPYAIAGVVLVLGIALAPDGGWVDRHLWALVVGAFALAFVGFRWWDRSHTRRPVTARLLALASSRQIRGPWAAGLGTATLVFLGGGCLAAFAGVTSATSGITPIDEAETYAIPGWLVPTGIGVCLLGAAGFGLIVLLAPKVDEEHQLSSEAGERRFTWALVAIVYLTAIFVGVVTSGESPQAWLPLLLVVICTPVCASLARSQTGRRRRRSEAEVFAGWDEDPEEEPGRR